MEAPRPTPSPASLRIELLGQGRLLVDGAPWKLNMARLTLPLLACLLLHRTKPVSRDFLAFTLWPDDDEDAARANLRRYIYQLQRALPRAGETPWLLVDAETAQWNPAAPAWLDVAEFEYRCENDRDLPGAVALYTGDLLDNLYDDWLFAERERLRHLCLAALDTLVESCRAGRDYHQAAVYARRLLALDPWREDVVRRLMSIRYEAGNGAGALAEYRRFAERLQAEMNVPPMPETTALRDLVARNAPLHGVAVPEPKEASTPSDSAFRFVGRDSEQNALGERWSRAARGYGGVALVAGEAGIGKTRLVAEVAHDVERQGGRVLWGSTSSPERVPYEPILEALRSAFALVAAADIEPVWLATLAQALPELHARGTDLPSLPTVDPEREQLRLFEALTVSLLALARPRPLLLVLEDLHFAGSATINALRFAARRAVDARLLIVGTYRDEEVRRLHPVRRFRREFGREPGFVHIALHGLQREDVRELLSSVPDLPSQPENLVAKLHSRSEGNPLFLRELVNDLIECPRDDDPEATSGSGIAEIVAGRVARLSPEARSLAEIAAVAGQGFDVDVVRDVSGWSEVDVLNALDELIDRHLVKEVSRGQRFDHAFAHHLIQSIVYGGIAPAVRVRRHRRIARVFEEIYRDRLGDMALDLAVHHERGGEPEVAAAYYRSAAERAFALYANEDALEYISLAVKGTPDAPTRIALLRLHEQLHGRSGDRSAQLHDLDELDRLAGDSNDDELSSEILWRRVLVHGALGESSQELAGIRALRARAERLGQERWTARGRQAEAAFELLAGRLDSASQLAAESLDGHARLDDVEGQVECLCLLAEIAVIGGSLGDARELLQRVQSFARSQTNKSLIGRATMAASKAALLRQDFSPSEELAREALVAYRTIGDREGQADALGRIAAILGRRFQIEEARRSYAEAIAIYSEIGKRRGLAAVLVNSGLLSFRVGQTQAALAAFEAAGRHFEALQDVRGQLICAVNRSAALLFSGGAANARAAALRALKLLESTRYPALEAVALGNLGAAERDLGDIAGGIAHINQSLALRSEDERPFDVLDDLADLALAHLEGGDLDAARAVAERLVGTSAATDEVHYWPWRWYWVAAQVYQACGMAADAERYLRKAHGILQERAERVVDPDAQHSFFAMPFNRELLDAHDRSVWPARVARFTPSSD